MRSAFGTLLTALLLALVLVTIPVGGFNGRTYGWPFRSLEHFYLEPQTPIRNEPYLRASWAQPPWMPWSAVRIYRRGGFMMHFATLPTLGNVAVAFIAVLALTRALRLRKRQAAPGHPACSSCGYDLHGISSPRCPECGESVNAAMGWHHPLVRKRTRRLVVLLALAHACGWWITAPDRLPVLVLELGSWMTQDEVLTRLGSPKSRISRPNPDMFSRALSGRYSPYGGPYTASAPTDSENDEDSASTPAEPMGETWTYEDRLGDYLGIGGEKTVFRLEWDKGATPGLALRWAGGAYVPRHVPKRYLGSFAVSLVVLALAWIGWRRLTTPSRPRTSQPNDVLTVGTNAQGAPDA